MLADVVAIIGTMVSHIFVSVTIRADRMLAGSGVWVRCAKLLAKIFSSPTDQLSAERSIDSVE